MLEVLAVSIALSGGAAATATQAHRDHDAPRLAIPAGEAKDFLEEVEEYVEVRRKAREELPKLKEEAEPEEVTAYAKQLTTNIALRRKGAKRGDVFRPKVAAAFRRLCRDHLARHPDERKTVLTEGNPTGDEERIGAPKVAVNAQYIPASPLSTVPPTLLLSLPTLPDEVEYRFIGRSLILRDTVANLIIDFVPNAVP